MRMITPPTISNHVGPFENIYPEESNPFIEPSPGGIYFGILRNKIE
jgi:hypothetical protein